MEEQKMDYRKLIKFGNSSHVVSIPNDWIRRNNLKKGDTLYFSENGNNELVLTPKITESKKEPSSFTINSSGPDFKIDFHELKRRIVSSYIAGYDIITIKGLNNTLSEEIKDVFSILIGLEITDESQGSVTVKDFLDHTQFSLDNTVRRINTIIRSMIDDILHNPVEYDSLTRRDYDINRLVYLSLRLIKKQLREKKSFGTDASPVGFLAAWDLLNNLEHMADELKRMARHLKAAKVKNGKTIKEFLSIFEILSKEYEHIMKCYFTKNTSMAYTAPMAKTKIVEMCNDLVEKTEDKHLTTALEKLKAGSIYVRNIARVVYELN